MRFGVTIDQAGNRERIHLVIDAVDVTLWDVFDRYVLVECPAQPLFGSEEDRNQQIRHALRANAGLVLTCDASLCLSKDEDEADCIAARTTYLYAADNMNAFAWKIEEAFNLAVFFQARTRTFFPRGLE